MKRARPVALALVGCMLATSTVGCGRGGLAKLAVVAAVVAVKTVQVVAASSRRDKARTRYVSTSAMPPTREIEGCGRCPEPDNGYAICFVSTCEARCIEGYTLQDDTCVPNAPVQASPVNE